MADVQPFRGLRYDRGLVEDVSSVICPPYDVISTESQVSYYQASPYNVIRLELGAEYTTDSSEENKYVRAERDLRAWLDRGVLIREPAPAFYVFEHRFSYEGADRKRWGLTARMRLEGDDTSVLPHESVIEERISDRLKLLRSCRVNLSPIMAMVGVDNCGLTGLLNGLSLGSPDLTASDRDGVTHNMWAVRDENTMRAIHSCFEGKTVYIADGHHRYETAVAYQREQRARSSAPIGQEAYNFVMVTLIGAEDPGLLALPTHRLVRRSGGVGAGGLRQSLEEIFVLDYLEPEGGMRAKVLRLWLDVLGERGKEGVTIGVYGLAGNRLCVLTPRDASQLADLMPQEKSRHWNSLDVSVLQWIILRRMMGIDDPQKEIECLEYTRDGLEAIEKVDAGMYELAFLMNAIPISSILVVAEAGERMPPKSTYFHPKIPTGLVMNPVWDD